MEVEVVKKLLPRGHRSMITQEFLDTIENSVSNTLVAEAFKDNFITYLNVLSSGKYKMESYINAIKFVSFKLMNYSDIDAYAGTFPQKFQHLKDEGQEQIAAYVSMFANGKLVKQIYEQTVIPTYVLNAPLHQETINVLADMIRDPTVRGMTKVKACETILSYTKRPEVAKGELSINIEQGDTINELREVVEQLAETHKILLEKKNVKLKEVASTRIVDITANETEEENK